MAEKKGKGNMLLTGTEEEKSNNLLKSKGLLPFSTKSLN